MKSLDFNKNIFFALLLIAYNSFSTLLGASACDVAMMEGGEVDGSLLAAISATLDLLDATPAELTAPLHKGTLKKGTLKKGTLKPGSPGSALLHAAKRGDITGMEVALALGAEISVKNRHGHTALILASKEGHVEAVEFLLNHGADVHATGFSGKNAFQYVRGENRLAITYLLAAAGAFNQ